MLKYYKYLRTVNVSISKCKGTYSKEQYHNVSYNYGYKLVCHYIIMVYKCYNIKQYQLKQSVKTNIIK